MKITETGRQFAEPVVQAHGCSLWDVEYVREGADWFLRLYIGIFRKQLYISVTNATGELVRKLDEEYITTKRGNHGHGLKRINNTVEKYGGFINRKNEPGVFATEIMLPL